jgi:hypothetical protein
MVACSWIEIWAGCLANKLTHNNVMCMRVIQDWTVTFIVSSSFTALSAYKLHNAIHVAVIWCDFYALPSSMLEAALMDMHRYCSQISYWPGGSVRLQNTLKLPQNQTSAWLVDFQFRRHPSVMFSIWFNENYIFCSPDLPWQTWFRVVSDGWSMEQVINMYKLPFGRPRLRGEDNIKRVF